MKRQLLSLKSWRWFFRTCLSLDLLAPGYSAAKSYIHQRKCEYDPSSDDASVSSAEAGGLGPDMQEQGFKDHTVIMAQILLSNPSTIQKDFPQISHFIFTTLSCQV